MAKILLGIALAFMLATATFGYLAKANADKLQGVLKDTKNTLAVTKTNLTGKIAELKTMTDDRDAKVAEIKKNEEEIATQKGKIDKLDYDLKLAVADLETKTKEVTGLNDKIAEIMKKLGPDKNIDELVKKVDELKAALTKAEAEAAENKALVEALGQQKKVLEEKVTVLEKDKRERDIGYQRQGVTGRILAVNSGWNFVVLSIGDKQHVMINATLLVLRNGQPIAKARITSVESATSIADIVPGSVVRGVTVQPGDTVVLEGSRGAPPAAAAVAPPQPVGAQPGFPHP